MNHGRSFAPAFLLLTGVALLHCSSSSSGASDGATCYPDNDGFSNVPATVDVIVDDTGFYSGSPDSGIDMDAGMKVVITTQNDSAVTLTLTNLGTKPHGFEVECTSATPAYPTLPAGCSSRVCFPSSSTIPPIGPGTSMHVTFDTPPPDGLLYPFKSSAPADSTVPGLNGSDGAAWTLI